MAEQTLIQFRADKSLKDDFVKICEAMGLDLPTAFRMFMSKVKMTESIPFEISIPKSEITLEGAKANFMEMRKQIKEAGVQDLSLDEINALVKEVRNERKGR